MTSIGRIWLIAIFLMHLLAPATGAMALQEDSTAQQVDYLASAQAIFNAMSVEERVGQLFLVTFQGDSASLDSPIADLILNYRVGGVVLLAENDNITGYGDPVSAPVQVAQLANDLQRLALLGITTAGADSGSSAVEEDAVPPTPLPALPATATPLLIGINREGDGYPYSHIFNGVTQIPSNMAIGATWQPRYARNVGTIVGQELADMGINMLLGPSLDVLENPSPFKPSDLGTRTFGGDPYWVGLMGQAYTAGVHMGSSNRVAVIAKHFPGNGGSDRPIDQEVPTVRKSLEQLKQIELAPFFAVTGKATDPVETADGLLTTHIRYQGFQGNIRATTNPVSFDPQALTTLMELAEFGPWRQAGGVIVSDALGVRAVERFYDPMEKEFPHRVVANHAFLAGNDLLFLADFALGNAPYEQQVANIKDTIAWFREKYRTDPSFAQRVDDAVLRILQLKLRLYGEDFSPGNVLVDAEAVPAVVGNSSAAVFEVAQSAVTLIAPSPSELTERLTSPPGANDSILIFTNVREVQQCSYCPPQPLIGATALEERILALYGPGASGQVQPDLIRSFSFDDLRTFLDAESEIAPPEEPLTATITPQQESTSEDEPGPTPTASAAYFIQERLRDVDWIIFATLDANDRTQALNDFLALRPDIVRSARVIVFAYNAPYYLDTTEISKLTAYYALYSKVDPFIDASVRALFQELPVSGAPPVDIEGISYELFTQTQPDPGQIIELYVANTEGEILAPPSQEPVSAMVGDTLRLQTGVIRDRNGHAVPDGTLVQFIQHDRIQGLTNIITTVPTKDGVAQHDYVLEARTGQFRITAESGEAKISQEIDISVGAASEGEAQVAIISPTPTPTETPTPTATPTSTPTSTATSTATATATPASGEAFVEPFDDTAVRITLPEIQMLATFAVGLVAVTSVGLAFSRREGASLEHQVGWLLWGVVGALLVYNYFAFDLPGAAALAALGAWAGLVTTLTGGALGLVAYRIRQRVA
ncbi:MAG TPA: glycoside hydrolase family 3 N-terminal domain-containing protein [Anaerolineae bacterium]